MALRTLALVGFVLVVAFTGCGEDVPRSGGRSDGLSENGAAGAPAAAAPNSSAPNPSAPNSSIPNKPGEADAVAEVCVGCARARASHSVCRECRTPYLCGIDVRSSDLHDLVDTTGHRYDATSLRCETCQHAAEREGWCPRDGLGFRRGVVHASRLGHAMSFGVSAPDSRHTDCTTCADSYANPNWCARCGRGRVGNLAFVDAERFGVAVAEFRRLRSAVEYFDECELCVLAHFSGMTCPTCRTDHPKVESPPR